MFFIVVMNLGNGKMNVNSKNSNNNISFGAFYRTKLPTAANMAKCKLNFERYVEYVVGKPLDFSMVAYNDNPCLYSELPAALYDISLKNGISIKAAKARIKRFLPKEYEDLFSRKASVSIVNPTTLEESMGLYYGLSKPNEKTFKYSHVFDEISKKYPGIPTDMQFFAAFLKHADRYRQQFINVLSKFEIIDIPYKQVEKTIKAQPAAASGIENIIWKILDFFND